MAPVREPAKGALLFTHRDGTAAASVGIRRVVAIRGRGRTGAQGQGAAGMSERRLPRLPRLPWRSVRADVDDELRFHIETATAELIARGIAPGEARAEAERRFGALTQ